MSKLESAAQSDIIKALETEGAFILKVVVCNVNGFPDLTILKPRSKGRKAVKICCMEVKREGEEPEPLQQFRHDQLRKYGVETYTVYNKEQAQLIYRKL